MNRKKHRRLDSLPQTGYNIGNEKHFENYAMTGAVYKVWCHVCSWNTTAGTVGESKYLTRKHEHIDTEIKRVA